MILLVLMSSYNLSYTYVQYMCVNLICKHDSAVKIVRNFLICSCNKTRMITRVSKLHFQNF